MGDNGLEGAKGEVEVEEVEVGVRWEPTAVFLKPDGRTLVWLLLKGVRYMCVLVLLYMCPHTTMHVLILVQVSTYTTDVSMASSQRCGRAL